MADRGFAFFKNDYFAFFTAFLAGAFLAVAIV